MFSQAVDAIGEFDLQNRRVKLTTTRRYLIEVDDTKRDLLYILQLFDAIKVVQKGIILDFGFAFTGHSS